MTTAIVFLFLALSAMQASGDGDPTLADVVSAHEAALGLEKHLLWRFDFDVVGESWSLGDLVRESGVAELAGKVDIDGHPTWHIRVLDPKSDGTVMPGFGFDIFVDPAVNFFVRRVIEHHRDIKQEINGVEETYRIDVTRTVTTFHDAGGGVFVPTSMKFRAVSGSSDRREMACETSVTDLKVNEDLSTGALDFRFPEDALVIYSPPLSPTRQRVVLWGPDNLPRKEIPNMHDIPGFQAALRQSDLDATRRPVGRDAK